MSDAREIIDMEAEDEETNISAAAFSNSSTVSFFLAVATVRFGLLVNNYKRRATHNP